MSYVCFSDGTNVEYNPKVSGYWAEHMARRCAELGILFTREAYERFVLTTAK